MRKTGIGTALFILFFISGCSTTGQLPLHESQGGEVTEQFKPSPGLGNLYIVRKTSLISTGADVFDKVNGQYIGNIEQNTYHLLELSPAEYSISVRVGKREASTVVRLKADENLFVQVEPGVYYKSELLLEQVDAEKGRELVGVGFRVATLPVEFEKEVILEDVLNVPAADLAKGYLTTKASLAGIEKLVSSGAFSGSGARFVLKIRGESIDKSNVDQYLARYRKQLSLYEAAIKQRGYANVAGTYKGEARKSCAKSNSLWVGVIQQKVHAGVEIKQEGIDAEIVVSLKKEEKEIILTNPAAISDTAIVVIDATNTDYYFRGEIRDRGIILKPDISVLDTWPEWASPPGLMDLENCTVTLERL